LGKVAVGDRGSNVGNFPYLAGKLAGHGIHIPGEVQPRPCNVRYFGLPAQHPFGTHFAGHPGYLVGKDVQRIHHGIDDDGKFQHFSTLFFLGDLLGKVAMGHCLGYRCNFAHLGGKVGSHGVYILRQLQPGPSHIGHFGLPAKDPFCSHFPGHSGYLIGEDVQGIHHGVNGFLQFGNFPFSLNGNFLGKVTFSHGRSHIGDLPNLRGQVGGHIVYVVRQVFPGSGHIGHFCLSAKDPFRTHFPCHPGHLIGKNVQGIHHLVDSVFQFGDFTFYINGDFLGKVAIGHRGCHIGNFPYLGGKVACHNIHIVCKVFPGTGGARNGCLPAQFPFGTYLARHTGYLCGKQCKGINHAVDGIGEDQYFPSFSLFGDFLRKVSFGHGRGHRGYFPHLVGQVACHSVHIIRKVFPGSRHIGHLGLPPQFPFGAYLARHTGYFIGENIQRIHHLVDRVLQFGNFTLNVDGDFL